MITTESMASNATTVATTTTTTTRSDVVLVKEAAIVAEVSGAALVAEFKQIHHSGQKRAATTMTTVARTMTPELTPEQIERMEANKKRAYQIRANRDKPVALLNSNSGIATTGKENKDGDGGSNVDPTPEQIERMEANRKKAYQIRANRSSRDNSVTTSMTNATLVPTTSTTHATLVLTTTSTTHATVVPYSSNLLDEEAEEEEDEEYQPHQAREQLTEAEINRLANAAERNRTSNIQSGLFSRTPVPEHRNDGDLLFNQLEYLLLAITKWNALTKRERLQFGIWNPVKPFYIFSGKDAVAAFEGLLPDEIEKLHITVLLGKLGVLAKALSTCRGDNSLRKLCGGDHNQYNNIDGARFVRGGLFLVANVQYTAEDESRFATCQAVDGGFEKVEELRLRANFNGARAPMQIIVSMNGGEIIHKYSSKQEANKDLISLRSILTSTQIPNALGARIDYRYRSYKCREYKTSSSQSTPTSREL